MKKNVFKLLLAQLFLPTLLAHAQGFVNLGFESANPAGYVPGTAELPTSVGLPGWTAYYSNSSATNTTAQIWYDNLSLGSAFISLTDSNNVVGLTPLKSRYSVLLEGSSLGVPTTASIGQTGQIPINALTLLFYASLDANLQVTFNGQLIPMVQTSATTSYQTLGGNITPYAGQTGQLLFTALPNVGYGLIDNIQFSSSSIPEPTSLALIALGSLLLSYRRWQAFPKI